MNASQREAARAWFIANREHDLSAEQRREFLAWLQESPVHVREYLAYSKLAVDLRDVMRSIDVPLMELVETARNDTDENIIPFTGRASKQDSWSDEAFRPNTVVRGARPIRLVAAVLGALVVGSMSWWLIRQVAMQEDYHTVHGEQRIVPLADGSVLHINSDSSVRVAYTKDRRDIVMKYGQALFKVAEDPSRPFRVRVGNTRVVAVGTEFDVHRAGDAVVITVVQGSVAVTKVATTASNDSGSARNPQSLQLGAGQQARVAEESMSIPPQIVAVRAVDVRPAVAWVEQKIMFEQETLQNVATEFNRYGSTQLIVEDAQIAKLRISGFFNAYDLESFVLYLESLRGLQVQRDPDRIRISLARNNDQDSL